MRPLHLEGNPFYSKAACIKNKFFLTFRLNSHVSVFSVIRLISDLSSLNGSPGIVISNLNPLLKAISWSNRKQIWCISYVTAFQQPWLSRDVMGQNNNKHPETTPFRWMYWIPLTKMPLTKMPLLFSLEPHVLFMLSFRSYTEGTINSNCILWIIHLQGHSSLLGHLAE